jgi:hypothetical protein
MVGFPPVVPATQEAEARRSLEDSLGDIVRPWLFKKKRKNKTTGAGVEHLPSKPDALCVVLSTANK